MAQIHLNVNMLLSKPKKGQNIGEISVKIFTNREKCVILKNTDVFWRYKL